jgi:hypothetical protein
MIFGKAVNSKIERGAVNGNFKQIQLYSGFLLQIGK